MGDNIKHKLEELYKDEINNHNQESTKWSDKSDEFIRILLDNYTDVETLNLMYSVKKDPKKKRDLSDDQVTEIDELDAYIKRVIKNKYMFEELSGGYDKPIKRRKKVKRKSVKRKSSKRKQRKSVKRKSSRSRKQTKRKSSRRKSSRRKSSKRG